MVFLTAMTAPSMSLAAQSVRPNRLSSRTGTRTPILLPSLLDDDDFTGQGQEMAGCLKGISGGKGTVFLLRGVCRNYQDAQKDTPGFCG